MPFASAGGMESPTPAASSPRETLVDRLRAEIRLRHYSSRTEEAYVWWLRRFVQFHQRKHPRTMGALQISAFLTHLAERGVSASTQNQARSALLFTYAAVLGMPIADLGEVVAARRPARLPVVLTRDEVSAVLGQLIGVPWLMASLMYGAGLRLMECAELRVKDVDLQRSEVVVQRLR